MNPMTQVVHGSQSSELDIEKGVIAKTQDNTEVNYDRVITILQSTVGGIAAGALSYYTPLYGIAAGIAACSILHLRKEFTWLKSIDEVLEKRILKNSTLLMIGACGLTFAELMTILTHDPTNHRVILGIPSIGLILAGVIKG